LFLSSASHGSKTHPEFLKDKQAFLFCKDILSIAKNAWKVGYGLLSFSQMCRLMKAYGGRLQTEPIFSNHSTIGG
jgi:hypothetical protein